MTLAGPVSFADNTSPGWMAEFGLHPSAIWSVWMEGRAKWRKRDPPGKLVADLSDLASTMG